MSDRHISALRVYPNWTTRVSRMSPERMPEQLARILTEEIAEQDLSVGDPLPGEHALCEAFGVSRTVVRQALADLEAHGVVQRYKGKGTFVGDGKTAEHFASSLRGLFDEAKSLGKTVRSEVVRQEWEEADATVANALEVRVKSRVLAITRLRFVDDEPWSWTTTWLRPDVGALVADADLRERSLYGVLAEHGVVLVSGRRTVEATVAAPEIAARLGISDRPAVMRLRSISRDARGRPVECFVAFHRGDRSRFEFEVTADNQPAF